MIVPSNGALRPHEFGTRSIPTVQWKFHYDMISIDRSQLYINIPYLSSVAYLQA